MSNSSDLITLNNDSATASISLLGAELKSLSGNKSGINYLWNGAEWPNTAPILFPIIGNLANKTYYYNNKAYSLERHGFARYSPFSIIEQKIDHLTLELTHSEDTLNVYPFKFQFLVTFLLCDNVLSIQYQIKNKDRKELFFSIGSHPALQHDTRSQLIFDHLPQAYIGNNGFVDFEHTIDLGEKPNQISLEKHSFELGAYYFKNVPAQTITLINAASSITMTIPDVPYLGIWKKPECSFICVEPWYGITDAQCQQMTHIHNKPGIISLEPEKSFSTGYTLQANDF